MVFGKKEAINSTPDEREKDMKRIEQSKDYIIWIQSFSKNIVTITFLLYLLINIYTLVVNLISMKMGGPDSLSIVYTEINETFRVVIGGYLIKAAIENSFKIGGGYLVGLSEAKLKVLKEEMGVKDDDDFTSSEDESEDECQ